MTSSRQRDPHARGDNPPKKKKPLKAVQQSTWKGFVPCELTEAQKIAAKAFRDGGEGLWERFFALVDDGYKLSLSLDTYNGAYVVSMTGQALAGDNQGWTLTARGGSMYGSMATLLYKHTVVLADGWVFDEATHKRELSEDDVG